MSSKHNLKSTLLRLAGVAVLAGGLAACGGGGGGGGGTTTPPTTGGGSGGGMYSGLGSGFATAYAQASTTTDPKTLASGDIIAVSFTADPIEP